MSSLNESIAKRPSLPPLKVVTSPRMFSICFPFLIHPPDPHLAWARDEPPSPTTTRLSPALDNPQSSSDAASSHTLPSQGQSRWWSFNLQRRGLRDFLPSSASLQPSSFYRRADKEKTAEPPREHLEASQPTIPDPAFQLTQHQANSPGWDTPWTSRPNAQGPLRKRDTEAAYFNPTPPPDEERLSLNTTRRKKIRRFILINPYVPLVSPALCSLHLRLIGFTAVPCDQYRLHHCCTRHSHSNTPY